MAQVVSVIGFETDLIGDAVDTLCRIHVCLTRRHGERFRDLERRIEAEMDGPVDSIGMEQLDHGVMVMTPPPAWSALIAEARSLGVI